MWALVHVWCGVHCAVTNVTGTQTSYVAVGGDVVNYTCQILFYGNVIPSLSWTPRDARDSGPFSSTVVNETISWEESPTSVQIPDGPATISRTCRVSDWDAHWSRVYFWQSTEITVSCKFKTF